MPKDPKWYLVLGTLLALSGAAQAQHPHTCDASGGVSPVLSVPDFDGDGTVTPQDVALIGQQVDTGEYVAFFDLNVDGVLDGQDVAATAQARGEASSTLEQQLAELYWGTEKYRDIENAYADGYRPFTQILHGHGQHMTRLPILVTPTGLDPDYQNSQDGILEIAKPEGLNYDENGNLIAVYYYHGIDVKELVLASLGGDIPRVQELFGEAIVNSMTSAMSGGTWPPLYDSPEALWHQHWGACLDDLDYAAMSFDTSHQVFYSENYEIGECLARVKAGSRQGYTTAFNMIHVWLYKLNPCGIFAGTHPHASMGYQEEGAYDPRTTAEWFELLGLPNPYHHDDD